jgi:hypothetical protein
MHVFNIIKLAVSLALEICLVIALLRRDVRRHLPFFFVFVLISASASSARMVTVSHYHAYFYVFWSSEALFLLFGLAALNEVFHWLYEGFFRLRWFQFVYYGVIALVLLVTVRNAMVNPPIQAEPLLSVILDIGIAVNLLQLGIAALFGALKNPLGIAFRRYPFGIAAGFAVSSMGPFIGYLARSVFGTRTDTFAQNASAVAYILALAVWVATFAWPEPEGRAWTPPMAPEEMLRVARAYLRSMGLGRLVGRNEDES